MLAQIDRKKLRRRVRHRIRRKVAGTAARPRLAVFRSEKHIYVQAIDDDQGRTVAFASTQDPEIRKHIAKGGNVEAATQVGKAIAERLKSAGVAAVVMDRGGWVFHGRIKALATAAREAGLKL
jgi:large subunit ribosomal protein L18